MISKPLKMISEIVIPASQRANNTSQNDKQEAYHLIWSWFLLLCRWIQRQKFFFSNQIQLMSNKKNSLSKRTVQQRNMIFCRENHAFPSGIYFPCDRFFLLSNSFCSNQNCLMSEKRIPIKKNDPRSKFFFCNQESFLPINSFCQSK